MSKLSNEDIKLVLELVKTLPIKDVADKFEVYPETIRYHMKANGAKFNGNLKAQKVKSANVLEQLKTKTITVIAKELGVSGATIYHHLYKQGVSLEDINKIQKENEHLLLNAIKKKISSGLSASEAIKAHGVTQKKYQQLTASV